MYVIFPIGWMYYFGTNLDERFSVPGFWPTAEQSHKIPLEKEDINKELARMRMADAVKRERRERQQQQELSTQAQEQTQVQSQSSE
jgi:protein PET100